MITDHNTQRRSVLMGSTYDINSDPFILTRIQGFLSAAYEWRLVNTVDASKERPPVLYRVSPTTLVDFLRGRGLPVSTDLCDQVIECERAVSTVTHDGTVIRDMSPEIHTMPLSFEGPTSVIGKNPILRAYVLRSDTIELALQSHYQEHRQSAARTPRMGSEVLRCSLRFYGDRSLAEAGTLAQRIKETVAALYKIS